MNALGASPSRYQVLTRIASGGMATVYVGRMQGAGAFSRLVAIKKPHSFVTANPRLRKQLQHEARVASMIHHPNVVSVLDVEESNGEVTLVMDYVDGCTLKELMDHAEAAGERIDRAAVRILLDVASGLHAAHCLRDRTGELVGVVHRDVSPQNVLVGRDGVARLTDFGIAKLMGFDREPTTSDGLSGKLAYLPPEYLTTKRFDAHSDLFSLAVVGWEALTQRRLFKGATPLETMLQVLNTRPPRLSELRPELTVLDDILALALERDPGLRPPSVAAFASSLEATARSIDCVAGHAEVGALVERLAREAILERQRALGAVPQSGEPEMRRPFARDELATQTLVPMPDAFAADAKSHPARAVSRRARGVIAALSLGAALTAAALLGAQLVLQPRPGATARSELGSAVAPAAARRAAFATPAKLSAEPSVGAPDDAAVAPRAAAAVSAGARPTPAVLGAGVRRLRRSPRAPSPPTPAPSPSPATPHYAAPSLFPERAPPNPYAP